MTSFAILDTPTHDINILLNSIYSLTVATCKIRLRHLLATSSLFILNYLPILDNKRLIIKIFFAS